MEQHTKRCGRKGVIVWDHHTLITFPFCSESVDLGLSRTEAFFHRDAKSTYAVIHTHARTQTLYHTPTQTHAYFPHQRHMTAAIALMRLGGWLVFVHEERANEKMRGRERRDERTRRRWTTQ